MTEHAPASCPHCAIPMRDVSARARSGYLLVLDQCPQCGGVWCDRWELFPLDAGEAARVDALDVGSLHALPGPPAAAGRCPRCRCALQPFRDPLLPADARIERCAVCDGMWMNRGELTRIKQRPTARPHPARDDTVERLAAAYGARARWSTVANLDAATYAAEPDDDPPEGLRDTLRTMAPWIALRALLRLLLGV